MSGLSLAQMATPGPVPGRANAYAHAHALRGTCGRDPDRWGITRRHLRKLRQKATGSDHFSTAVRSDATAVRCKPSTPVMPPTHDRLGRGLRFSERWGWASAQTRTGTGTGQGGAHTARSETKSCVALRAMPSSPGQPWPPNGAWSRMSGPRARNGSAPPNDSCRSYGWPLERRSSHGQLPPGQRARRKLILPSMRSFPRCRQRQNANDGNTARASFPSSPGMSARECICSCCWDSSSLFRRRNCRGSQRAEPARLSWTGPAHGGGPHLRSPGRPLVPVRD
jgi:hypothetical protein